MSLMCWATITSAEQAKASEYRRILESGTFYIEYSSFMDMGSVKAAKADAELVYNKEAFAVNNDKKIAYTRGPRIGDTVMMQKSIIENNPLFKDWAKTSQKQGKWRPEVMYRDGKYYQFFGENSALMAPESQIMNSSANELWNNAVMKVGLPPFFLALVPNHPELMQTWMMQVGDVYLRLEYISECVENGRESVLGETMNFDKYVVYQQCGGTRTAIYVYYFFYDDTGNLRYVKEQQPEEILKQNRERQEQVQAQIEANQKVMEAQMGKIKYEKWIAENGKGGIFTEHYYSVDKITGELPIGIIDFPAGCKVYSMDTGSLDDLVGSEPVLVEQY